MSTQSTKNKLTPEQWTYLITNACKGCTLFPEEGECLSCLREQKLSSQEEVGEKKEEAC